MSSLNITQSEADILIRMEKRRQDERIWEYPGIAEELTIPLISENEKEHFLLDISRGRIVLKKGKYQVRGRKILILVRLDFGGSPHRNPDGQEVASTHLHLYREGYGDKWAFPISVDKFPNITDLWQTLNDFMVYCAITQPPYIEKGLWV